MIKFFVNLQLFFFVHDFTLHSLSGTRRCPTSIKGALRLVHRLLSRRVRSLQPY
jgi:hypothetical protein